MHCLGTIISVRLGLLVSASLPVLVSDHFVGVVAVEVNLNEVLRRETQLDSDDNSYYFLISRNGDTFYHPMLPQSLVTYEQPIMVFIGLLEKEAMEEGIIASMMRYDRY